MGNEIESYAWLILVARLWVGDPEDDQGNKLGPLANVNAQAGIFQTAPVNSANDPRAFLAILLFIWLWNCAKYRANLAGFVQNRAKNHQNNAPPFFGPSSPETRSVIGFANLGANFSSPSRLCQINSSPTPTALNMPDIGIETAR